MPPQDQAPVKDTDLKQMPMNSKEGDRYVVNYGEGLKTVDFGGHVSLAEKEGVGMAERRSDTRHAQQKEWSISCPRKRENEDRRTPAVEKSSSNCGESGMAGSRFLPPNADI
ncbi:hypothetical protein BHE74_00021574 [Ensete ventricosum]|nr:hypothetical protein GW17_00005323 [Ensete ventricosum]RWW70723.1 hypothetical protein BHE74_00021574 [Ensete ventricosum]